VARRKHDALGGLVIIVVLVGIVGSVAEAVQKNSDTFIAILIIGGVVVASLLAVKAIHRRMEAKREEARRAAEFRARYEYLTAKYPNDDSVVAMIMLGQVWKGMSKEQLLDSMGHPADVGVDVRKNMRVETYKYGHTGKNRFLQRVMLEDGTVVGWKRQ